MKNPCAEISVPSGFEIKNVCWKKRQDRRWFECELTAVPIAPIEYVKMTYVVDENVEVEEMEWEVEEPFK